MRNTLLVALVVLSACRSSFIARVRPLETTYPVSASERWVDEQGRIVTAEETETTRGFAFERHAEGVFGENTTLDLDLRSALDAEVAAGRGDAVTRLSIRTLQVDPGDYGRRQQWDEFGWGFIALAAVGGGVALVSAHDEPLAPAFTFMGVFSAVGLGMLGLAHLVYDKPPSMTLAVTGDVVRRRVVTAAPRPEAAEPR